MIPARAAPPAISGVFAFEANSATFPPALPTAPLELLVRAWDVVRRPEFDALGDLPRVLPARELVLLDLLDEPFRLVDLVDFEPARLERVLDDGVV